MPARTFSIKTWLGLCSVRWQTFPHYISLKIRSYARGDAESLIENFRQPWQSVEFSRSHISHTLIDFCTIFVESESYHRKTRREARRRARANKRGKQRNLIDVCIETQARMCELSDDALRCSLSDMAFFRDEARWIINLKNIVNFFAFEARPRGVKYIHAVIHKQYSLQFVAKTTQSVYVLCWWCAMPYDMIGDTMEDWWYIQSSIEAHIRQQKIL